MSAIEGAIMGAVFAVFVALGLIIGVQHHRLAEQEARYEALTQDNAALLAENNNWKIAAGNQNKKLESLAAAGAERDAAAARAEAGARKTAARYAALAAQIAALKTPAGDCAGAAAVRDFYLRRTLK